jgi:flagellar basal-body rod protein FlgB
MADSMVFGKTFTMLKKALDISSRRHSLISTNLANMDTIGYKPKDIDFNKTLEREISKGGGGLNNTHPRHYSYGADNAVFVSGKDDPDAEFRKDSVDIDKEISNLSENNIKYRVSVELLIRKVKKIKHVIQEGGK